MKTNNKNYTALQMLKYIQNDTKFSQDDVLLCISILTEEQKETLFKNHKNIDLKIKYENKIIPNTHFHKIMMSCAILMDLREMRKNKNNS